jgi:hypothetical protein
MLYPLAGSCIKVFLLIGGVGLDLPRSRGHERPSHPISPARDSRWIRRFFDRGARGKSLRVDLPSVLLVQGMRQLSKDMPVSSRGGTERVDTYPSDCRRRGACLGWWAREDPECPFWRS